MGTSNGTAAALNGISPYFTMFPLEFPQSVLAASNNRVHWVLDPFCGRGTTNLAARLLGMPSVGIDSSPVAVALSWAKLVDAAPAAIVSRAREILAAIPSPECQPEGEFWEWAYHPRILDQMCRLREGLLRSCETPEEKALRAIILGALHGPLNKVKKSYFSNQSQRTYAPKPGYAARYWKSRDMRPPDVDVVGIIRDRAERYYTKLPLSPGGMIVQGDSRDPKTYAKIPSTTTFRWIITSPPYYGMRTYLPDQWLRLWFLGGPARVDYAMIGQLEHASPSSYVDQLRAVWINAGRAAARDATLVIRFGGINKRPISPLPLLIESLQGSGWAIQRIQSAGFSSLGRRQALHILRTRTEPLEEFDVFARQEESSALGTGEPFAAGVYSQTPGNAPGFDVSAPIDAESGVRS